MADGIKRCTDPADPERCKGTAKGSQCMMKVVPGTEYCPMHGGRIQENVNNRKELNNLRLTKWRAKLIEQTSSPAILCIRDEIGVARICLQEIMEKCDSANELIIYEPNISRLVMNISKLVDNCFKLETGMGQLLDKAALAVFAGKVIDVICTNIDDEELRKKIAGEIVMISQQAGKDEPATEEEQDDSL